MSSSTTSATVVSPHHIPHSCPSLSPAASTIHRQPPSLLYRLIFLLRTYNMPEPSQSGLFFLLCVDTQLPCGCFQVNGVYVVPAPVEEVRRHLSSNQSALQLVVARSRLTQGLANPVAGKLQVTAFDQSNPRLYACLTSNSRRPSLLNNTCRNGQSNLVICE